MARLTVGQKTQRMLDFLMGFGNRSIRKALEPFGFDDETYNEGWFLLRRMADTRLDEHPMVVPLRAEVRQLDEWENLWF